jgi:dihydroorotase
MKTLIKGAQCVFPDGVRAANLVLEDDIIADIDAPVTASVDNIIDATGLHLIPGVIDDQVHFRDPGLTHKEDLHTGSLACAKGGLTTFLEMPNTRPPAITQAGIEEKLALGAAKSVVNYGFYIGATPDNVDDLRQATRVPGIKIFIGSSTGDLLVDEQAALDRIFKETSLPICAHCEDETTVRANTERLNGGSRFSDHSKIRDHAAAVIATERAITLAHKYNHRFHVLHVSTADELPLIQDHRNVITAEVCPHHLFFNVDDYEQYGSLVQMNPSIKNPADNAALWDALADNTIQVIATDHAPHTKEEKDQDYPKSPSGLPAVENSLALMLNQVNTGRLTLERLVESMCDAPARVWDIVNKGRLEVGFDADVVLVDLQKVQTVNNDEQLTKSKWSPWHGETLTGWAVRTIVMGKTVFMDGIVDTAHRGQEAKYDHSRGGYWS